MGFFMAKDNILEMPQTFWFFLTCLVIARFLLECCVLVTSGFEVYLCKPFLQITP